MPNFLKTRLDKENSEKLFSLANSHRSYDLSN